LRIRIALGLGLLVSCFCWSSCGGGSQVPGTVNSGNWSITGTSTANQGQSLHMAGTMTQTGNSVIGDMVVVNAPVDCLTLLQVVNLSGSFSGDVLTFSSLPINGEVITLKLKGTGSGLSGTYTVLGGGASCDDAGTATAAVIPAITGVWTGTLRNLDGTVSGNVQVDLTEGPFGADGYSPLSGTASLAFIDPTNPRNFLPPTTCPLSTSGSTISAFSGGGLSIYSCFTYHGVIVTPDTPGSSVAFQGFTQNPTGSLFLTKLR
jgi:hypothetical protein